MNIIRWLKVRMWDIPKEQRQIKWEQDMLRHEQDRVTELTRDATQGHVLTAMCKTVGNVPSGHRELLGVLTDIIEWYNSRHRHWIMGLNVRIGNINELLYKDRRGFGKDGSYTATY